MGKLKIVPKSAIISGKNSSVETTNRDTKVDQLRNCIAESLELWNEMRLEC